MKTLHPMDIEEFLMAMGEDELIAAIKKSFEENTPMPSVLHDIAMEYYRKYLVVVKCLNVLVNSKKQGTIL